MKILLKQKWNKHIYKTKTIFSIGLDTGDIISNIDQLEMWVGTLICKFSLIVVENETIYFAAVDHLANFPIYYSTNLVTDNWYCVTTNSSSLTLNSIIEKETWLLGGQNLSHETCYNEVYRIKPNHFLSGGIQQQYRHLNQIIKKSNNIKEFIINKFLELEQTDNTLMFSGGVDSVFLMNLVLKYGTKNWRFIHMHSTTDIHNETKAVEYFEDYFKTTVEKYNIEDISYLSTQQLNTINELEAQTNFSNYWYHDELYGKFIMFQQANVKNELIWTGEVADQLFGNPKIGALLPTWIQTHSYDAIADLWIDTTRSLVKSWICDVSKNYILKQKLYHQTDGDDWQLAYSNIKKELIQYFTTGNIEDLLVKFTNFNYMIKGQLRVWPYSQLPQYSFAHLFSYYELVPEVFSLSSDELSPNGLFKGYLYNMFKDDLPEYAWTLPKTGPTQKIKRLHNEIINKF